ncbi:hypothetical protein PVAG01_05684 [Phlyctema vagabunda]|uniref:Heterokaryon incompatibility domain-containing protein n=1 Tax=Phlyctema vagabunda TaxID=108571 RepID=A0ABR4PLH9_9HELO
MDSLQIRSYGGANSQEASVTKLRHGQRRHHRTNPEPGKPSCKTCYATVDPQTGMWTELPSLAHIIYGWNLWREPDEAIIPKCILCDVLRNAIDTYLVNILGPTFGATYTKPEQIDILSHEKEVLIRMRWYSPKSTAEFEIYVSPDCQVSFPGLRVTSVLSDALTNEASLTTAKFWFDDCVNNHGCLCDKDTILPKRVLDLNNLAKGYTRLIESDGQTGRYATLSHRWGQQKFLRTLKSNIEEHKHEIALISLPKSFQDAMSVTKGLGISYLWIDSLCIVQDDFADWEREAAKMADIYSQGHLNISAIRSSLTGDGFFGERWIRHKPDWPMRLPFVRMPYKSYTFPVITAECTVNLCIRPESRESHRDFIDRSMPTATISATPLLQRGWVFQERLLSPRTIHFGEGELVWECRDLILCECGHMHGPPQRDAFKIMYPPSTTIETLDPHELNQLWLTIVENYSSNDLTFDTDCLPALSGIASRFQRLLHGRYLAGIWENHLVDGLAWSMPRFSRKPRESKALRPTWSWTSGQTFGEVMFAPWFRKSGDRSTMEHIFIRDPSFSFLSAVYEASPSNPFGQPFSGTAITVEGLCVTGFINFDAEDFFFIESVIYRDIEGDMVLIEIDKSLDGYSTSMDFLPSKMALASLEVKEEILV